MTLHGGGHSDGFEDTDSPYDALVDATTVDFWNAFLAGAVDAADRIAVDGTVDGLSSVQHDG